MRIYQSAFVFFLVLLLRAQVSIAQEAIGINPVESPLSTALSVFQQDRLGEACPVFREWREQLRNKPEMHLGHDEQAVVYHALLCGLRQAESQAAQDALHFIAGSPLRVYQDRLHGALADYFFRKKQWSACLDHYRQAGIAHFTNPEIAAAQFKQGYAHFVLAQFKEAKTFFNSVRSLADGVHKADATYYYALLLFKERSWGEAQLQLQLLESDGVYGSYVPYYIAQILLARGEVDEAISYVLNRQKQSPAPYHQKELKQLLGQAYFLQEDYGRALTQLSAYAAESDSLSRQDNYQIAYSLYQTGQWSLAAQRFRELSAQSDSLGQHAMFLLGDTYLKQGDYGGARSAFLFCVRNSTNATQREASRFLHAKLSYQLGFFDEALVGLKSFLSTYGNSVYLAEAKELQLAVLAATSNYKEALGLLDQLIVPSEPTRRIFAPVLYGRAAELINDGDYAAADLLLDRALNDPYNQSILPYLFFWKGELAFRSQRYQDAVDFLLQYLQKGAPTLGEIRPQHARYSLAYAYLRLARYEQSLPLFQSVAGKVESNAGALVQDAVIREADCLLMLKRYGQAAAAYQRVVDYSWKEADYALYQLAIVAGIKNPEEKIRLLRLFEQSYPGSPLLTASWMALADTYMEDERFTAAKPFLEKIIAKEKSTQLLPQAFFKLGIAHYNSDDNAAAREQFNYILDHFPNSEEAGDALDNLKAIYLEEGRSAAFIEFVKEKGLSLSATAEDSLRFSAAEQLYNNKSFGEASQALQAYLSQVDRPAFALDAYAMLAAIAQQNNEYDLALRFYDSVLVVAPNRYAEEAALQAARISYFEQRTYDKALLYYEKLYALTGLASSKLESLRGLLRACYQLDQIDQSAAWGALLINMKGVNADDKALVALVIAKQYTRQGREEEAQLNLRQVISLNKASLAAEARYELACSQLRQKKYAAAEKSAFETINKSGSFEVWVTRAYLLLGDIYFAQADYFNAKATYQSVKENANAEEFIKIAAEKVAMVEQAEAEKVKPPKK
ncbi:MAG: hypothetical protein EB101_02150 [Chitinophagia bacterium]|nr:hypothetical protein [Chitinophagia bacterium]